MSTMIFKTQDNVYPQFVASVSCNQPMIYSVSLIRWDSADSKVNVVKSTTLMGRRNEVMSEARRWARRALEACRGA